MGDEAKTYKTATGQAFQQFIADHLSQLHEETNSDDLFLAFVSGAMYGVDLSKTIVADVEREQKNGNVE